MMPGSERDAVTRFDSSRVTATRVNVKVGGNIDLEQRIEELDWLPRMKGVIDAGAGQEGRPGVRRRRDVHWRPSGINQTHKIGPATHAIERVRGVRLTPVKSNVRERGERASGRKPEDAD